LRTRTRIAIDYTRLVKRPLLAFAALAPLAAACAPSPAATAPSSPLAPASGPVVVQVLAFNDFHGNLEPPSGTNGAIVTASGDGGVTTETTGGAAYLAAHVKRLRAENPRTVVVSAGDLTGASPLVSNLFKDAPAVEVMNALGLDFEGVGNHDFDRGLDALRDLQKAAKYTYLAANVRRSGEAGTIFPPYAVRDFDGAKVAFVGLTLEGTPGVTAPAAVKGLTFSNEAATVNALVPELEKQGVAAIVLLLHQGGMQGPGGTYDSCVGFSGDLLPVLDALSPAVKVVVSAHTHQAYDCTINGRLVTSAASYGRLVTKIDLTMDRATHSLTSVHARNVPVTRDVPPDPAVASVIATYEAKATTITQRLVGWVARDLTGNAQAAKSPSCETPLGDVIADSQREATGADVAFMNPGGIRADLVAHRAGRPERAITYAEAFEVEPFGNSLVTMTLTGDQIVHGLLERQFGGKSEPRILQPSSGFTYRYTYDRASRSAKVDDVRVNGAPLDPKKGYRVTVNGFLANGGDTFGVLRDGPDRKEGGGDLDALLTYLEKHSSEASPLAPPAALDRVRGDGCL
jgi:5'-nucleotidase